MEHISQSILHFNIKCEHRRYDVWNVCNVGCHSEAKLSVSPFYQRCSFTYLLCLLCIGTQQQRSQPNISVCEYRWRQRERERVCVCAWNTVFWRSCCAWWYGFVIFSTFSENGCRNQTYAPNIQRLSYAHSLYYVCLEQQHRNPNANSIKFTTFGRKEHSWYQAK